MNETEDLYQKNKRVQLNLRELTNALQQLPGWEHVDGKLRREFAFKDFTQAFSFMTAVALKAEKIDHHPEWSNVYNRVVVELRTHDTVPPGGGVTPLDTHLAKLIDEILGPVS